MTFYYRQLVGVSKRFHPIALSTTTQHLDVFPFDELFIQRKTFVDKLVSRAIWYSTRKITYTTPRITARWVELLRRRGASLIHAHFGPNGLDMLPVAKKLGIPLVVSFHGYDASMMPRRDDYMRALPELFDVAYVITASEDFLATLKELGANPKRLRAHHIGIPVDKFDYVARRTIRDKVAAGEELCLLQASNFVEKKGHPYTLEAFARFLEAYPSANLVLAGDGPTRPATEELSRRLGIADKVQFLGRLPNDRFVPLMNDADMFLHHSVVASDGDKEATTTVIAEAMATGLPVFSSYHGGIPEMITNGENGFLVDERDVDAYAAQLVAALDLDDTIGRRARETVERHFNLAEQNDELMDIYDSIISGGF